MESWSRWSRTSAGRAQPPRRSCSPPPQKMSISLLSAAISTAAIAHVPDGYEKCARSPAFSVSTLLRSAVFGFAPAAPCSSDAALAGCP